MATLINGNGNNAVYAQQDADLYAGALGESTRILNVGSKLAYTIEDANTIAVADGVILTKEGRRIQVDVGSVDEFTIPTGAAGVTRYYIIGYHLYTDGSANQKCETFVQLMASESETIPEAEFREGATEVYVSLYRIKQIGLNLDTITALLSVGIALTDMTDVIGDTDISGIGDGTLTGGLNAVNQNLTEKVAQHSDATYQIVKGLGYDAINKKLGLVIEEGGADSVIPFDSSKPMPYISAGNYNSGGSGGGTIQYLSTDGTYKSMTWNGSADITSHDIALFTGTLVRVNLDRLRCTLAEGGKYILTKSYTGGISTIVDLAAGTEIIFALSASATNVSGINNASSILRIE